MSKLHAQFDLFGAIDDAVCNSTKPETAEVVEAFLPGTTGVGQRGWYRELKHFISKPAFKPRDDQNNYLPDAQPVWFHSYADALTTLSGIGADPEDTPIRPDVLSRSIFAATILEKIAEAEGGPPPLEGWVDLPNPLDALLPELTADTESSTSSVQELAPAQRTAAFRSASTLRDEFLKINSRKEYELMTMDIARSRGPRYEDVMGRPVVCTGCLREVDGQFCTLLTTSWEPLFTLRELKEIIDPHNWPKMCDFFVGMKDQDPLHPDPSRGWTRVLESVSFDKTLWEMQTALRYWKGTAKGGIYINYDLDKPRLNDNKSVEIDAGYIWITPIQRGNPNTKVKIRTSKQVKIRGVSPTATAALSCTMGWGDASSQMYVDGVQHPPKDRVKWGRASSDPGPLTAANAAILAAQQLAKDADEDQVLEDEAEQVELIPGWRSAMITNTRDVITSYIGVAETLGVDFAKRWSDGMSADDVVKFSEKTGHEMTKFAQGLFTAASDATKPPDDKAATGGHN